MTRHWLDAAWPLALLVLFVATFRQTPRDVAAASPAVECDQLPPGDLPALERCVELEPRNVQLLTDLGDAYAGEGAIDRAESMYRRALALDPHDGEVHVRLGELLLRRGDRSAAAVEAEEALRWEPGTARAARLKTEAREPAQ